MAKRKTTGGGLTPPKGEIFWVQYRDKDGKLFACLTSKGTDMHNADRGMYYVYEAAGEEWNKLGRGKNPTELEKKYVRFG